MKRSSEEQHRMMLETPMTRLVMSLALPTTISQLVSVIYNTADTYFVSQISTSASAAVGVVFSLMSIIQAVGFGIGMGASSLASRRLGEKRDEEAHVYCSSAFFAAFSFGLLLMVVGLACLEPLMRLLGSTETMLPHSCSYGRLILIGAPVMCSSFVLNATLRSEGEAVLSMWGLCTGGILNIFLDPLFIFTLDMGIAGAALATILSQTVSFCILLSMFLRGRSIVQLKPRYISRRVRTYWAIVRTGLPTICRQGLASVASAALNNQAAVFGDAAVAAMTISNKVYLFVRHIVIGIGQGFQPVAGYNFGAGNRRRVREAFRVAVTIGSVICCTGAVVTYAFAEPILRWFRDDPAVIEVGAVALRYAAMVMPVMAYSTYVNQLYQSLGFAKQATFLAACRQGICYLPLILILPAVLGLTGVQLSQPGADLLTFFVSIPFHIRFYRTVLRTDE